MKAWVTLMDTTEYFWDVLTHDISGVVLSRFLSFDFPSVVVTVDCLHDNVWITCKSVLCVNFIFPLCQCNPGKSMGPSLSPVPAHLLWFPFVCSEGQRHRALCPDFNSSARERCFSSCVVPTTRMTSPKMLPGFSWLLVLRSQERWKIRICLKGEKKKKVIFMHAVYFVIHTKSVCCFSF